MLAHPDNWTGWIHQVGIVPCGDGDDSCTVAALIPHIHNPGNNFLLHVFDTRTQVWTSKKLHVKSPQRDFPVKMLMERDHQHKASSFATCSVACRCHFAMKQINASDSSEEDRSLLPDGKLDYRQVDADLSDSYDDWHKECTLQAFDVTIDGHTESELLPDAGDDQELRGLQNLIVSGPYFGSDNSSDIIYLTARVKFLHPNSWVLAVDIKNTKFLCSSGYMEPLILNPSALV
nr:uncharacterized protein LOC120963823 [Aegilops tauschii subsp. strangulata]